MTGSVYTFFVAGWHYVPGPYVSKIHVDPGRISKENVVKACKMFEYDCLMFEPRICRTCLFPKPARSKHCSLCKMCVAKSDHHFQICFYGTYIILCIFCGIAKNMKLSSALVKNPITGMKRLFIALVGIVILVFLGYQFYLIFSGFTSNESSKWSEVEEIIMDEELWVYESEIEPKSNDNNDNNNKSRKKKKNNDNVNKKDIGIEEKERKVNNNIIIKGNKTYWIKPNNLRNRQNNQNSNNKITSEGSNANSSNSANMKSISEVKNIYDKGKWNNLLEVLFPPSL
ncbi:7155_t:CDS:2 [Diversispora eburnea]|uniref:Palmitoyltransferase n=1 Tax=Diversispora eburnea TaxID=1213867 RepID=A0A9N9BDH7_9GLOM|nr:7155_t:CDS:2 [Diversispora eburnea]